MYSRQKLSFKTYQCKKVSVTLHGLSICRKLIKPTGEYYCKKYVATKARVITNFQFPYDYCGTLPSYSCFFPFQINLSDCWYRKRTIVTQKNFNTSLFQLLTRCVKVVPYLLINFLCQSSPIHPGFFFVFFQF